MLARIIGVFKLSAPTFEEIEHNTNLTLPARLSYYWSLWSAGWAMDFSTFIPINPFSVGLSVL